jgi:hypothetical protein
MAGAGDVPIRELQLATLVDTVPEGTSGCKSRSSTATGSSHTVRAHV